MTANIINSSEGRSGSAGVAAAVDPGVRSRARHLANVACAPVDPVLRGPGEAEDRARAFANDGLQAPLGGLVGKPVAWPTSARTAVSLSLSPVRRIEVKPSRRSSATARRLMALFLRPRGRAQIRSRRQAGPF
ncbi:hypothetical protein [Dactylosporangium salmoneum]|uniref:Uncharacterized protein n=1 Tax=Dactylosporangium salmoneum TaxID=53361 RepID=A0ABN3GHR5_9ACTN